MKQQLAGILLGVAPSLAQLEKWPLSGRAGKEGGGGVLKTVK